MRYVALLRAVNVGGNTLKMADVRKAVAAVGYQDVETYIQTGNVLFSAPRQKREDLEDGVARALQGIGHHGQVFVRTRRELEAAAEGNPFRPRGDVTRSHIMFLAGTPADGAVQRLMAMRGDEYRFHVDGPVLYYAYDAKDAGNRRRSIPFERVLGVPGTARAWNVVDALIERI